MAFDLRAQFGGGQGTSQPRPPLGPDERVASRWTPQPPHSPRPLLVTRDGALLDDIVRLAAAAGTEVEVCPDVVAARRSWGSAPLVLADDEQCEPLARARLPRRGGVVVVGRERLAGAGAGGSAGSDAAAIWRQAVAIGAEHVAVLPDAEPWLVARFAEAMESRATTAASVGVVGGRGGAGASTLAAALSVMAMRRSLRTTLVDADPFGGGIDLLFGGEQAVGLRWPDLGAVTGRLSPVALTEALPRIGGLAVLSWGRASPAVADAQLCEDAVTNVVRALLRAGDLVVFDLPRHAEPAGDVALAVADVVLLVVPLAIRAAAAAARVAAAMVGRAAQVYVVERGPAPGGLAAGDVAANLGLPLAGYLRPEPGLAAALERGDAPAGRGHGPLARFCDGFLDTLLGRGQPASTSWAGRTIAAGDLR